MLGFLRVGWKEQPSKNFRERRSVYTWFAVGDPEGLCPACGIGPQRSLCRECDSRIIEPDLLVRVGDFAIFQAVEHLE